MSEKDIPPKTREKILELLDIAESSLLEIHHMLRKIEEKEKPIVSKK